MTTPPTTFAIVAGIQLADDLRDDNGSVLLPKGCILTPAMVNALHRRGVVALDGVTEAATNELAGQSVANTADAPLPLSATDSALRITHIFRRGGGAAQMQLQSAIRDLRCGET